MLQKISLSAMTSTYLFAGAAHFLYFDYFTAIAPPFLGRLTGPLVVLTGALEILFALFLPLKATRKWGCYGLILLISVSLPINLFVLSQDGMGIPLSREVLVGRIPFQMLLLIWAVWHSLPERGLRPRVGDIAGRV